MFRKTILSALAAAAVAAAAAVVLSLKNRDEKEEEKNNDDDDEIHFIEIKDEPEEEEEKPEEKPHEVHVEEVKMDEGQDEEDHVTIETFAPKDKEKAEEEATPAEEEAPEAEDKAAEGTEEEKAAEPQEETEPEEVPEEVKEIAGLYPYLDLKFIQEVLKKDPEYKEKYPDDTLITIRHTAAFKDEENALKFVSVMEDAGYHCEKTGDQVTAEVRLFCEDGSIISDTLNVANQVKALDGEYKDTEVSE